MALLTKKDYKTRFSINHRLQQQREAIAGQSLEWLLTKFDLTEFTGTLLNCDFLQRNCGPDDETPI